METGTQLAQLEDELNLLRDRMAGVADSFVRAAETHLKYWYWEQTESYVTKDVEHTRGLAGDRLSALKAEVQNLLKQADELAEKFLNVDEVWWHRKSNDELYFTSGTRPPKLIDNAVRLAAGLLGPILKKYGYLRPQDNEPEEWLEWDDSGRFHPKNARPYYPYHFAWSEEMTALVNQYEEIRQEAARKLGEIESIRRMRAGQDAKELWDKS